MAGLKGGISSRQAMVNSFIAKNLIEVKAKRGQGLITAASYFQQRSISGADLTAILGSEQDFLQRYSEFEKNFHLAIDNKLNHAKGVRVNAQLMKKQGKIDLSVLNAETADKLYKQYTNDVLRMGELIQKAGLPSIEMPTANLYRKAFKFEVDQSKGILHPAQLLLNRTMFNFNAAKSGLESLTVGRSNILSHSTVSQLFEQSKKFGPSKIFGDAPAVGKQLKILTFDVETTGVTQFSNVRSMSMAEMIMDHTGKITAPETIKDLSYAFKSPQMAGIKVGSMNGGVQSLHKFLADVEGLPLGDMGPGGKNYLDATEKFFNRLLEADRVAGHNINFDIDMIMDTAIKQEGFAQHTGVNKAFQAFTERRMQGNYVIDTLESTRSYLQGQVQELVDLGKYTDLDKRSAAFVNNLFSQEILARTHIGGSAAYGSVENIALNTNLFELIERDGQAEALFEKITRGSHIAETDVHLQSHIARYVQSGELKIWPQADKEAEAAKKAGGLFNHLVKGEFGDFARSKILQSSAITPTTNIADVKHMSETVFDYLSTSEGRKGMSLSITKGRIEELSGIDFVGKRTDPRFIKHLQQKGVLEYTKSSQGEGFHFVTSRGKQLIDQTQAQMAIDETLRRARTDSNLSRITVGNLTRSRNLAAESILDTGITIERASRADEAKYLSNALNGVIANSMTADDLTSTFGTTYRELGTGLAFSDQSRVARGRSPIQSVFQAGLNDYSYGKAEEIAKAFAKIGDPYATLMTMDDRVFSTIMASSTARVGLAANRAGAAAGYAAEHIAHSAKPNLTAELGMSYFHSQRDVRLLNALDSTLEPPKLFLPPEIVRAALEDVKGTGARMENIGLSIARRKGGDSVNAVFMAGRQLSQDEGEQLAKSILKIMQDRKKVVDLMGGDEAKINASVFTAVSEASAAGKTKAGTAKHVETMVQSIMERGIVVGQAGEAASEEIINQLGQAGVVTGNDVLLNHRMASEAVTGVSSDFLVVNPFMDREALNIAGLSGALQAAEEVVDNNGVKLSKSAIAGNKVAEVIGQDASTARNIGRNITRGKMGENANTILEMYSAHKAKLGYGALGLGIAAAGYYMFKKHRERQLYNETLEQQPTERAVSMDQMQDSDRAFTQMSSFRRDPLATAGVVGNLDRAKIGHTQMGPNKYNHLFGG